MHWLSRFGLVLALGAFAGGTAAAGPNLVVNGDFESPTVSYGHFGVFTTIPGWVATYGPGIEIQNHAAGTPYNGSQLVELDSHGPSGMQQVVPVVPGANYTFRFAYSPRPGCNDNGILVKVDGQVVWGINDPVSLPDTEWRVYVVNLVAQGPTMTLAFEDISVPDSLGGYIDGVELSLDALTVMPLFNTAKAHPTPSTIPIKLQMWSGGVNMSSPDETVLALVAMNAQTGATYSVVDSGASNPFDFFRYDPMLMGYIFNLKTDGMPPGNYVLKFVTSWGPEIYEVGFRLK